MLEQGTQPANTVREGSTAYLVPPIAAHDNHSQGHAGADDLQCVFLVLVVVAVSAAVSGLGGVRDKLWDDTAGEPLTCY